MNTRNDWEQTLQYANEALEKVGYEIKVRKTGDGDYTCKIYRNGRKCEDYAEGYFEDELDELVHDAWSHARKLSEGK